MNRAAQAQPAASDMPVASGPQPAPAVEAQAEPAATRQAGLLETARAVLWSFFGVRGRREHERDAVRLNPLYVILMGIALAAGFVAGLVTLVRFIVS
jgi:preprotein translocase subunit Sec61beta